MRSKEDIVYNDHLLDCHDIRHLKMKHIVKCITNNNISKCYHLVLANVIMSNGYMEVFMGVTYPSIYHIDDYIMSRENKLDREMLMLIFIHAWLGE